VTISNNYFADNYQQGLQLSQCQNYNVTGNYSFDSGFDIEDSGPQPSGYDIETWINNTFACDGTATQGELSGGLGAAYCGAKCFWNGGSGCSAAEASCSSGQYKNVVIQNNTITGPGSVLMTGVTDGPTLMSNTYSNGGLTLRALTFMRCEAVTMSFLTARGLLIEGGRKNRRRGRGPYPPVW
jgi:hypothetical protein